MEQNDLHELLQRNDAIQCLQSNAQTLRALSTMGSEASQSIRLLGGLQSEASLQDLLCIQRYLLALASS